jgi:hypothetical protein
LGGHGRNNYQPSQRHGGDGRYHAALMVSPAPRQDIRTRHLAASNVRRTQYRRFQVDSLREHENRQVLNSA